MKFNLTLEIPLFFQINIGIADWAIHFLGEVKPDTLGVEGMIDVAVKGRHTCIVHESFETDGTVSGPGQLANGMWKRR